MNQIKTWSQEETDILIENIDKKTYKMISELLIEKGYFRTVEGIRKKSKRIIKETNEDISGKVEDNTIGLLNVNKTNILNKYIDNLKDIIEKVKTEISEKPIAKKNKTSEDKEALILMLSDLHIGKEVKDYEGNVLYNSKIAITYLQKLIVRLKHVMEHAGKGTNIDEIVILCIGDLVDNEAIYSSQPFHLDIFVADQVKLATKLIWELIVEASNIKGIRKVSVVSVRGNHGRMTFGSENSNWDNVIHNNLYMINSIANNPKIEIGEHCGEFNIATVKGHRILIRHYAPSQTETAAAKAKFSGWIDTHKVDAICYGHYHHYSIGNFNNRTIVRNGSLPGSDDLAERMAVKSDPCQMVFGVSKNRLPTFIYPLTFNEGKML